MSFDFIGSITHFYVSRLPDFMFPSSEKREQIHHTFILTVPLVLCFFLFCQMVASTTMFCCLHFVLPRKPHVLFTFIIQILAVQQGKLSGAFVHSLRK